MEKKTNQSAEIVTESINTQNISKTKQHKLSGILGIIGFILIVIVAIVAVWLTFYMPIIRIAGNSCEPVYHDGDILVLLDRDAYKSGQLCCVAWENKLLLRRVIGVAGDIIDMDEAGNVYVNDILLDEPYATNKSDGECDLIFPYKVPDGELFMLGDSRDRLIDSRSSAVGCIKEEKILGQILFRIWSLGHS